MTLTLARMRIIAMVLETGSLSAAARRLGLSVPTLAQAIRETESAHDVVLFVRQGQQLHPSATAEALYPLAVEMREAEARALQILRAQKDMGSGSLRVGLGNAMPGMSFIAALRRQLPSIEIQVETGNWATILAAVDQRELDIGVLPDVPGDSRFDRVTCLQHRVVAVMSPANPLSRRKQSTCADLQGHNLIFRKPGSSTQLRVDRGLRRAGLSPRPVVLSDTRDGVLEAVLQNLGIGFVWEYATSRQQGLIYVPVEVISEPVPEHVFIKKGEDTNLTQLFFRIAASPTI